MDNNYKTPTKNQQSPKLTLKRLKDPLNLSKDSQSSPKFWK